MSEEVFDLVTGGSVKLLECNRKVFAYASVEPLQLKGKCNLNVCIPQTKKSLRAKFYVTQGEAATLLSREASELLGVLRVGVSVNNCDVVKGSCANVPQADRKASLKARFPQVFQGLGKFKGYQLRLRIYETVRPVAQPVRRIPFTRGEKVTQKLDVGYRSIEAFECYCGFILTPSFRRSTDHQIIITDDAVDRRKLGVNIEPQ